MRRLALLLGLLVLHQTHCFEFVVEGEWETETSLEEQHGRFQRAILTSEEQEDFEAIRGDDITVKSYKVESRITSRFCHTTVKSSVVNSGPNAQSIGFNVQIPKRAFITNFTMNVNGITFVGSVKEKTVARNLYAQARARGKAAGLVRANSQDMETFKTEVHVPPGSKTEFELHYQEMMQRKLGFYEHSLYLQPGRLVPQFQVDVYIYEPSGIASVETPNTLGEHFSGMAKLTSSKNKAHVVFKPSLQQQRKCENCTTSAIDGIFTVKYDVLRDSNAGELHVSDGHFVHFFAPANLSPLPKNIVFVIDVSGSMWGVKMKQTVEAMQTILDDLTMDDYFSIVDFNHNVRCWSEELVPGSTIQVAEAKKYIQNIKPNGGTNINEALMRAVQMLVKASNQGMIDPRSVSMIMLVSDGDPTVGEIKLSAIQKNVKKVMREEFSLFSLGIGFDVDYDFLERIAMENRGVAQRIYTSHDASDQIRRFYSQVSSPLLRKITVQFPENSVSDVTQNHFDKYFSGSELVVAGKVLPSESTTLNSFTTASADRLDLSLQTEADYLELDAELAQQQHAFTGFARQMWAYITVNQLLAERSLAPTAGQKRKITQRILTLAVEHQFVTPLTALLVESEEAKERLLADSPKDPKQGCCAGGSGMAALGGRTPVQMVHSIPPWVQMTTPAPPSHAERPLPDHITIVENDPHFIVHLPKNNMDICFNIDSEPGHILNLVSDPGAGVVVNGQLVGSKRVGVEEKEKVNTYFGTVSVFYQPDGIRVSVSTDRIDLTDGRNNHSFTWGATADITQDRVKVSIVKDSKVMVTVDDKITVMVLLHRVWKKHPTHVDFLGLYIPNNNQYSSQAHGLIGQFGQEPEVRVFNLHQGADPRKKEATMEVKGNKLVVTSGQVRNMATLKDITIRLKSIKNIQKITKSMKMVAAAKYARAERQLKPARVYGNGAVALYEKAEIKAPEGVANKHLLIGVSSDRGLCGAVHSNVAKAIKAKIATLTGEGKEVMVVNVGDKLRNILQRTHGNYLLLSCKEVGRKPPTFTDASIVATELLNMGYEFDQGAVIYNRFRSVISYKTDEKPIFSIDTVANSENMGIYDDIDADVLRNYQEFALVNTIYFGLKESTTSEQSARMTAMDSASKNASEMIDKLTLTFNRTRQAVITKELIEIISGAAAL